MTTIRKVAWTHITPQGMLFARSKGQTLFFNAGGKIEPGETNIQALQRECLEECGTKLKPETVHYVHTFIGPCYGKPLGTQLEITCYEGEPEQEPVASSEVVELKYFTSAHLDLTTPMGQEVFYWHMDRYRVR